VSVLQAYQEYWREIGVEMIPTPEPFQNLVSRITETFDFDTFYVTFGWGPTPDQSEMWKCDSYGTGFNMVKYCNPLVDELLDKALSELDQTKRIELYTEFQNALLEDLLILAPGPINRGRFVPCVGPRTWLRSSSFTRARCPRLSSVSPRLGRTIRSSRICARWLCLRRRSISTWPIRLKG